MKRAVSRQEIAQEAKALVALAFRNGPIETVHAGRQCPTCTGDESYSRITDDEMKKIMTVAVNQMYKLLILKAANPDEYQRQIKFGERYTTKWEDPDLPKI